MKGLCSKSQPAYVVFVQDFGDTHRTEFCTQAMQGNVVSISLAHDAHIALYAAVVSAAQHAKRHSLRLTRVSSRSRTRVFLANRRVCGGSSGF